MSFIAFSLILVSAFMHAGWNFVSKRRSPSLAFFSIAALSAFMVMSPFILIYRHILPLVLPHIWYLILLTGFAQLIYLSGLAGAYQRGDMSLAYPLARALPVLLVAGISLLWGNGGEIGQIGLWGMGLIAVGCIVLPLKTFRQMRPESYLNMVCLMALIAAVGTTSYTLIDDQALRLMRDTAGHQISASQLTLLYIAFQSGSTALTVGLATLLYPPERQKLIAIVQDRSLLTTGLLTGVVIMATYGLAMASMAYVTNVSYVAAFRQLSIPIGAVLGMTLQAEPRHRPKLIGILIISCGLILVGLG